MCYTAFVSNLKNSRSYTPSKGCYHVCAVNSQYSTSCNAHFLRKICFQTVKEFNSGVLETDCFGNISSDYKLLNLDCHSQSLITGKIILQFVKHHHSLLSKNSIAKPKRFGHNPSNCQSAKQQKSDPVFVYPSDVLVFRK